MDITKGEYQKKHQVLIHLPYHDRHQLRTIWVCKRPEMQAMGRDITIFEALLGPNEPKTLTADRKEGGLEHSEVP